MSTFLSLKLTATSRAILASFLLGEELGHLGRLGCTLCLLGSLIIVLHAPDDKDVTTVDEILHYAVQPGTCCSMLPFDMISITPHRFYDVLLYRPRSLPGHDIRSRTSLRSLQSPRIHLHMLSCRLNINYGYQRLRHRAQANVRW